MSKIIIRGKYVEMVKPFIGTNLIKVFVGQRRVGKSFVMHSLVDYLKSKDKNVNILFIDKELSEFDFIQDSQTLKTYAESALKPKVKNVLFIDEIQEIKEFEKALRHLHNKGQFDIYCTGSNANLLSGELATTLSGRHISIKVSVLTYKEFLLFNSLKNSNTSLTHYLTWGGLPFIKNLVKNDEVIFDYLKSITSAIIYKDVVRRYNIRNVDFFENLIKYLANNSGNIFSAKKISDYLKSQKIDISTKVILSYLNYLENAFLINKVSRTNLSGKNVFATQHKFYFEDWGIRNSIVGKNNFSIPSVLENVVYNHLRSCGYEITIGVIKNTEVDFIARKDEECAYFQVAYTIPDEKVKLREYGNLLAIKDNFPKYVVTLDDYQIGSFEGIKHLHLRSFLLKDNY